MGWQTAGHNLTAKHRQPTQLSSSSNREDRRERWGWIEQELGKGGVAAQMPAAKKPASFLLDNLSPVH